MMYLLPEENSLFLVGNCGQVRSGVKVQGTSNQRASHQQVGQITTWRHPKMTINIIHTKLHKIDHLLMHEVRREHINSQ